MSDLDLDLGVNMLVGDNKVGDFKTGDLRQVGDFALEVGLYISVLLNFLISNSGRFNCKNGDLIGDLIGVFISFSIFINFWGSFYY